MRRTIQDAHFVQTLGPRCLCFRVRKRDGIPGTGPRSARSVTHSTELTRASKRAAVLSPSLPAHTPTDREMGKGQGRKRRQVVGMYDVSPSLLHAPNTYKRFDLPPYNSTIALAFNERSRKRSSHVDYSDSPWTCFSLRPRLPASTEPRRLRSSSSQTHSSLHSTKPSTPPRTLQSSFLP